MALAPDQKNAVQLLRGFRSEIESKTGITNFDSDSKARALMDVFVQDELDTRNGQLTAFYAQQLSNARGADLEQIGAGMGVPKFQFAFATSNSREQNFGFYVESGTFGTINGGADITIPKGTLIQSDPNENELGATITYVVQDDVALLAANALGYVTVRAQVAGVGHNVGAGVMRNHNFTGYVDSAAGSLKIINFYSVLNGREVESDTQYRFRLAKNYDRLASSNDTKVHLTALRVPGVLDVRVLSNYFGVGTAGVLVLGADFQSNAALVRSVQDRLDTVFGPGLKAVATGATSVTLDFELEIAPRRVLTAREKQLLETQVRQSLLNEVRSVGIGGTVTLRGLARSVQERSRGLVRLGNVRGREGKLFKKVYVSRGFSNGINSERERLIASSLGLKQEEYPDIGTITFTYV